MSKRNLSMRERSRTQIQKKGKTSPTFKKAAEEFLLVQRGRGNKPATLTHYGNTIKKLKRFLAWYALPEEFADLTEEEIIQIGNETKCTVFSSKTIESSFRVFLLDIEEVSEVTVSTYFRDYRAIAYWMMDEDIVKCHPPREQDNHDGRERLRLSKFRYCAPFIRYRRGYCDSAILR